MRRFEAIVAGICLGAWLVAGFLLLREVDLSRFPSLRALFPIAGVIGWLAGNLYVQRSRSATGGRRGLLALYLGGPPGLVWLCWASIPRSLRVLTPLTPLLALTVFAVFFLVPISLRSFPRR